MLSHFSPASQFPYRSTSPYPKYSILPKDAQGVSVELDDGGVPE